MELKTVEQIIKVWGRNKYYWYNWGEPLLYNGFHEFIGIVKHRWNSISSSFSLQLTEQRINDLAEISEVVVSMSGLTKNVYNLYHVGGNFDLVMYNVNRLIGLPTTVRINWIKHPHNKHQEAQAFEWCMKNGFVWGGLRCNCEVEDMMETDGKFNHPYLKTPRYYSSKHFQFCKVQRWIPIDVDGHYLLCCTTHNRKIGYTVWDNITQEELRQVKMKIPFCQECYAKGYWRIF